MPEEYKPKEELKRKERHADQPAETLDIQRVFREVFSMGPGGGGAPRSSPDKTPKRLTWDENFELDPAQPHVTVSMNSDAWADTLAESHRNHPYGIDHFFNEFRLDSIRMEVEDIFVNLETTISYRGKDAILCWVEVREIYAPNCDVFNMQDVHAFRHYIEQTTIRRLTALGMGDMVGSYGKIQLKGLGELKPAEIKAKLVEWKKAVAFAVEIMLRSLKDNGTPTLKIPNPKVEEEATRENREDSPAVQRQEVDEAVKEKVKGLEVTDIHLRLEDMGGNPELKEQIKRLVSQYQNPDFFEQRGVRLPKGILLYGPPGTGKTLSAKIFAGEIKRKFYHVKASDILSKYYGESEQAVKDIFQHVEGPCIIFIDEIDSIGEHRDYASEPTRRVLSELLQQLDGLSSRKDIILLAATNRKESLDPALLRPGRFDRHLLVDKPDEEARKQIWSIHIEKQRRNSEVQMFAPDLNVELLAKENNGLVGADIEEIVRRAKEKNVFESFERQQDVLITTEMLMREVQSYRAERDKEAMQRPHHIGFAPRPTQEKTS